MEQYQECQCQEMKLRKIDHWKSHQEDGWFQQERRKERRWNVYLRSEKLNLKEKIIHKEKHLMSNCQQGYLMSNQKDLFSKLPIIIMKNLIILRCNSSQKLTHCPTCLFWVNDEEVGRWENRFQSRCFYETQACQCMTSCTTRAWN